MSPSPEPEDEQPASYQQHEYAGATEGEERHEGGVARSPSRFVEERPCRGPLETAGYGIVESVNDNYLFRVDAVRTYLRRKEKYTKLSLTDEEKIKEISERRNALEPRLRRIVRQQLLAHLGRNKAKQALLQVMRPGDRTRSESLAYDDLFDPRKTNVYFDYMRAVVDQNWVVFQNVFCRGREEILGMLAAVNKYRADAHAARITDAEMQYFRVCIAALEDIIAAFLD